MSTEAKAAYVAADYPAAVHAVEGAEACFDGSNDELAEALRWRAPRPRASTVARVVASRAGQIVFRGPAVAVPDAPPAPVVTPAPAQAVSVAPVPVQTASSNTVWWVVGGGAVVAVIAGAIIG